MPDAYLEDLYRAEQEAQDELNASQSQEPLDTEDWMIASGITCIACMGTGDDRASWVEPSHLEPGYYGAVCPHCKGIGENR